MSVMSPDSGQKIGLLFEELVSTRTRASDFNELPIPFRAISADLVTGTATIVDAIAAGHRAAPEGPAS